MKKIVYIIPISVFLLALVFYVTINFDKKQIERYELPKIAMINPVSMVQDNYIDLENVKLIQITKETSDSDFLKIMEDLKKEKIDVIFSNVKRNNENFIINIDITVSKNGNTQEYSANNTNGIYPIIIKIKDDFISITDENQDVFTFGNTISEDDGMAQIQKMMQQQMQMLRQFNSGSAITSDPFFSSFFNDSNPFGNDDMLKKMMESIQSLNSSNNNSFLNKQNKNADNYTQYESKYIVNGKEMSEEEYKKMDKSKIRSLQIYKSQVSKKSYSN